MKKIILVILIMMMTLSLGFADMSDWAQEYIEGANVENLIPLDLSKNYQDNINRYEYVLLANKLLDKLNIEVEMKELDPFTDIKGHPFKSEILKAYNAGIITGYPDNTFKPNKEITRQEIATLVYKLVNKMSPVSAKEMGVVYSDDSEISDWARKYVDFCYTNKILNGVGKINGLDTINPLGNASIEQSITLIYRLFVNKELVVSKEDNNEGGITNDNALDEASKTFGDNNLDLLVEIVQNESNHVDSIDNNIITLKYDDDSKLVITQVLGISEFKLFIINLDNKEIVNDFKKISSLLSGSDDMGNKLDEVMNKFKENENYQIFDTDFNALHLDTYYSISFIYRK